MYKPLFALLYLPLSLLAQTTQPSHCLAGFLYAKLLAPTGLEWQNPESYALNKEQPRADFHSFATRSAALGVLPEYSEYYRSLDGRWHFHWARNPEERPKDFHHPNFDVSCWNEVNIPMNWNVYGIQRDGKQKYGTPIYVNQPAIFYHERRIDDWRKGVIRAPPKDWTVYEHRNEVGSYRRTFSIPKEWQGRKIYLNFEGVDSFFYVWINGLYVFFFEKLTQYCLIRHYTLPKSFFREYSIRRGLSE